MIGDVKVVGVVGVIDEGSVRRLEISARVPPTASTAGVIALKIVIQRRRAESGAFGGVVGWWVVGGGRRAAGPAKSDYFTPCRITNQSKSREYLYKYFYQGLMPLSAHNSHNLLKPPRLDEVPL